MKRVNVVLPPIAGNIVGAQPTITAQGENLNAVVTGDKSLLIEGADSDAPGMVRTIRVAPGCWVWYSLEHPADGVMELQT